jgi:hypothetical protein
MKSAAGWPKRTTEVFPGSTKTANSGLPFFFGKVRLMEASVRRFRSPFRPTLRRAGSRAPVMAGWLPPVTLALDSAADSPYLLCGIKSRGSL